MNRVLLVVGAKSTGELYQKELGAAGYQTAVVWNPIQMVEFCRQHEPDFIVTDLAFAEQGLWSAIQAVKGIGTLANVPLVGVSLTGEASLLEQAKNSGYCTVLPINDGAKPVIDVLNARRGAPSPAAEAAAPASAPGATGAPVPGQDVVTRDPSINKLREIVRDIISTTETLKAHLPEYGEDGPELFGYIESSGIDIREKLNVTPDFGLHDKELRHDFRNMIGSVTGFAELIMMEPGISETSSQGMARLREWSREFVEILDQQKASTEA